VNHRKHSSLGILMAILAGSTPMATLPPEPTKVAAPKELEEGDKKRMAKAAEKRAARAAKRKVS